MDLRSLQQFIAVAELEHVGKAAEKLHISQSPLSRQIRQLEAELGLELFLRERRRLQLTEHGRWFLEQAKNLIGHKERIRSEAEQRALGKSGKLTIAYTSPVMWNDVLPQALKRFQEDHPKAVVELENLRSSAQIEGVRAGRIDLAFVSAPPTGGGLRVDCVSEEGWVLAVPCTDPMAQKEEIHARDLDGRRWIILSETADSPGAYAFAKTEIGTEIKPESIRRVSQPLTLLALVQSGLGVGFVRESARNYAPASLAFRGAPWLTMKGRTFLVRGTGTQPLADAFAKCLRPSV